MTCSLPVMLINRYVTQPELMLSPMLQVPLLGSLVEDTADRQVWQQRWSPEVTRYLANHQVSDSAVAPGTCYLEMARAAVQYGAGKSRTGITFTNMLFTTMLVLDGAGIETWAPQIQVEYDRTAQKVKVSSRLASEEEWAANMTLDIILEANDFEGDVLDIAAVQARCTDMVVTGTEFYNEIGNKYLGAFQAVSNVWCGSAEILVQVDPEIVFSGGAEVEHLHGAA